MAALGSAADLPLIESELHRLLDPGARRKEVDLRVEKVQELIRHADRPPTLDELARAVGLSRFRLSHLYKQETGFTLRRALLWEKLVRAVDGVTQSKSLTDAAMNAHFSDHAHFTRTMDRFVGQPPSYLTGVLAGLSEAAQRPLGSAVRSVAGELSVGG